MKDSLRRELQGLSTLEFGEKIKVTPSRFFEYHLFAFCICLWRQKMSLLKMQVYGCVFGSDSAGMCEMK